MPSYREQLAKIGIAADQRISYRSFDSRPKSLRTAMRSMDAPAHGDWHQASEFSRDEFWTDEVQGVAWNGSHWIFSTNANQAKPDAEDKALYVFPNDSAFRDGDWVTRLKFKDVAGPAVAPQDHHHWGQITYYEGHLYVSHFWSDGPMSGTNVVVFACQGPHLSVYRWRPLPRAKSPINGREDRVEFQAINPWDGLLYSCFGGEDPIYEFFKHDPASGDVVGILPLAIPVSHVQGACFSPNGHLYVASNLYYPDERYQTIHYYSALNGHRFGVISVLAEEGMPDQELEGVCVAGGRVYTVLLENPDVALDNIFFKGFATSTPDII